ncbi:MAG: hypothetical protein EZS28_031960 [Streblomastix strix]|uniref:Uncharacterized protein n=1 Tax=Streblomastix strix TaxID=222440 RepID=A0A5J4UQD3_9EUKA|nr:MAG: hypothetical protein EZS28_031960 [Streblomastix strix]
MSESLLLKSQQLKALSDSLNDPNIVLQLQLLVSDSENIFQGDNCVRSVIDMCLTCDNPSNQGDLSKKSGSDPYLDYLYKNPPVFTYGNYLGWEKDELIGLIMFNELSGDYEEVDILLWNSCDEATITEASVKDVPTPLRVDIVSIVYSDSDMKDYLDALCGLVPI